MPGITTLADARVELLEMAYAIEPYLSAERVTSGNGNAGGTTAQINALGFREDDSYMDTHWLVLPNGADGNSALEASRVSGFIQNDGSGNTIITVYEAFSGQVLAGVAAYISPLHPEMVRQALVRAAPQLFPTCYVPRRMHHVAGSRAYNGFFDFWESGLPIWWAKSDAALTVEALSEPYFGEYGVTFTADASDRYLKSSTPSPAGLNELAGYDVTLHAYIRATAANEGGISISDGDGDGATVFHTGDGTWQHIQTAARNMAVGRPGVPIEWRLHVAANATVDVGPVWTTGGPYETHTPVPNRFRSGPSRVEVNAYTWPDLRVQTSALSSWAATQRYPANNAGSNYAAVSLRWLSSPTPARLLVIRGEDYISQPSAETDVFELVHPHLGLLYARAMSWLSMAAAQLVGTGADAAQKALSQDWNAIYEDILKQPGIAQPQVPVSLGGGLGPPGAGIGDGRYYWPGKDQLP